MVKSFFKNHLLEIILSLVIIIISIILIISFNKNKDGDLIAKLYYYNGEETIIVKEFDLSKYQEAEIVNVDLNDEVTITLEIKKNNIRVVSAPCKKHLCVNQGFTSNPNKPIICLDLEFKIILYSNSEVDLIV